MTFIGYRNIDFSNSPQEIKTLNSELYKFIYNKGYLSSKIFVQKLVGHFLISEMLVDMGYPKELVYNISTTSFGKPELPNTGLYFNISHCQNLMVAIVSDVNEVGIDVEMLRPISLTGFSHFFKERDWNSILNSENKELALLTKWTIKEAVLKCAGTGFQNAEPLEFLDESGTVLNSAWKECFYYRSLNFPPNFILSYASSNKLEGSIPIKKF